MYLSSVCIVAWALITLSYALLCGRYRRAANSKDAHIRDLERTVEKLKSKNGKLWYDIINSRSAPKPDRDPEWTITTKIAT